MVLLVGSHADEVADPADIPRRLDHMRQSIQMHLDSHRAAQQAELELLPADSPRGIHLTTVLRSPLRLAAEAVAVSAKTLDGVDVLQEQMVEAAFDKAAFPSFGAVQARTYGLIHRHLLRAHATSPSLTWPQLQTAASTAPEMSGKEVVVEFGGSSVISGDRKKDDYRQYKLSIIIDGEHLRSAAFQLGSGGPQGVSTRDVIDDQVSQHQDRRRSRYDAQRRQCRASRSGAARLLQGCVQTP